MQRPRKMEHAEDLNVTQKQQVMFYHLRQLLEQLEQLCNVRCLEPKRNRLYGIMVCA